MMETCFQLPISLQLPLSGPQSLQNTEVGLYLQFPNF